MFLSHLSGGGEDLVVSPAGFRGWRRCVFRFAGLSPLSQCPFGPAVALLPCPDAPIPASPMHSSASGTSMNIALLSPPRRIRVSPVNSGNCCRPNWPPRDTFSSLASMIVQLMFPEHLLRVRQDALCFHPRHLANVTENDYYFTEPSITPGGIYTYCATLVL